MLPRPERLIDPTALRREAGMGREQEAGSVRLGEKQDVPGAHAPLAHQRGKAFVDQPVDRETKRDLATLAGVPAYQRAARLVQDLDRSCHHLTEIGLDLPQQPGWEQRDRGN
jgi:hypothetical protein